MKARPTADLNLKTPEGASAPVWSCTGSALVTNMLRNRAGTGPWWPSGL